MTTTTQNTIRAVPLQPADLPVIEQVLAAIRPRIQADGGDIELHSASGDTVVVRMQGKCMGCIQSGETLGAIRRQLMHALGKAVRVIPALEH